MNCTDELNELTFCCARFGENSIFGVVDFINGNGHLTHMHTLNPLAEYHLYAFNTAELSEIVRHWNSYTIDFEWYVDFRCTSLLHWHVPIREN